MSTSTVFVMAVMFAACNGYSEWNPTDTSKDNIVIDMRNPQQHKPPPTPQQLLSKAAGVPWEDKQDHGTASNPYGDITEHYNDLTNNQGDGSYENLVVNANLTMPEAEEET